MSHRPAWVRPRTIPAAIDARGIRCDRAGPGANLIDRYSDLLGRYHGKGRCHSGIGRYHTGAGASHNHRRSSR